MIKRNALGWLLAITQLVSSCHSHPIFASPVNKPWVCHIEAVLQANFSLGQSIGADTWTGTSELRCTSFYGSSYTSRNHACISSWKASQEVGLELRTLRLTSSDINLKSPQDLYRSHELQAFYKDNEFQAMAWPGIEDWQFKTNLSLAQGVSSGLTFSTLTIDNSSDVSCSLQ